MLKDELQVAQIGSAKFNWRGLSTSGGRKQAVHEYPNADYRSVEDLGLLPRTFTISGSINEPNYTANKSALLKELESGGVKRLVHPTFGSIDVTPGPYTLDESLGKIGEATLSMIFYRVDRDRTSIPKKADTAASEVNSLKDQAQTSVESNVSDAFKVSGGFPDNSDDAKSKAESISAAILKAIRPLEKNETIYSRITEQAEEFTANALLLISDPDALADGVTQLVKRSARLTEDQTQRLALAKSLFGFGDDDEQINQTTTQRIERKRNRDLLNGQIKTAYLAQAYDALVNIEFDTVDDLDIEVEAVEAQYEIVAEYPQIDNSTIEVLADIRSTAQTLLNEKRLTAQKIVEVETSTVPMAVLAYQYYGSTDNTDKLIALNSTRNPSFVMGTTKIVTA